MRELLLGPDRDQNSLHVVEGRARSCGATPADANDALRLDCTDCVLEPGRVNAHTHIYSALAPLGMPEPETPPENFVQILERIWWRLDRALDAASLRASARLYAAEALLAGTTTLIDHHESPQFIEGSLDVLADACAELGIRAVLCYGATERNGGREEARRGLAECRRFIESNQRRNVRGVVGLHASFTVSDETIREAGELCRALGTVLHVHLAEDTADVRDAEARGHHGPLERLLALEALPEGSIVAHGVHLDGTQVARLAEAGCWIVQNPRSNRGNRVGYPTALARSQRVALGTDGYPSIMEDEQAVLFAEARLHGESSGVVSRRLGSSRALAEQRFGVSLGSMTADSGDDRGLDVIALAEHGARHVLVAGDLVVQDRVLRTADVDEIRGTAVEQAPRVWKRMKALR